MAVIKTEQICVRMGLRLMERAKKRAEEQEKSLAEYIRSCVEKDLKEGAK